MTDEKQSRWLKDSIINHISTRGYAAEGSDIEIASVTFFKARCNITVDWELSGHTMSYHEDKKYGDDTNHRTKKTLNAALEKDAAALLKNPGTFELLQDRLGEAESSAPGSSLTLCTDSICLTSGGGHSAAAGSDKTGRRAYKRAMIDIYADPRVNIDFESDDQKFNELIKASDRLPPKLFFREPVFAVKLLSAGAAGKNSCQLRYATEPFDCCRIEYAFGGGLFTAVSAQSPDGDRIVPIIEPSIGEELYPREEVRFSNAFHDFREYAALPKKEAGHSTSSGWDYFHDFYHERLKNYPVLQQLAERLDVNTATEEEAAALLRELAGPGISILSINILSKGVLAAVRCAAPASSRKIWVIFAVIVLAGYALGAFGDLSLSAASPGGITGIFCFNLILGLIPLYLSAFFRHRANVKRMPPLHRPKFTLNAKTAVKKVLIFALAVTVLGVPLANL